MKSPFEAFSVECGTGWKHLYQPLLDLCEKHGITVMQVKEKFGGLRFYVGGHDPAKVGYDIYAIIGAAESASYHTCEDCGVARVIGHGEDGRAKHLVTTGPSETSHWVRSLCPDCRKKWDDSRRERMTP